MISQELNENEHYEKDIHKSISYLMNKKSVTDQQSDLMSQDSKHDFDIGKLVEWNDNGEHKFVEILDHVLSKDSTILNKARVLSSTDEFFLTIITLSCVLLVPSAPNEPDDINISASRNELSTEYIEML